MLLFKQSIIPFCTGIVIGFYFDRLFPHKTDRPAEIKQVKMPKIFRNQDAGSLLGENVHTEKEMEAQKLPDVVTFVHDNDNMSSVVDSYSDEALEETPTVRMPVSHHSSNEVTHPEEDVEAERLAKQVRVLCWIMTGPSNHEKKAIHVKNTWGKRCNKLIFMSSQSDENLGAVGLPNVQEGREGLWVKTREAFKYVWEHHRDEADWFMKADDDTYVIVENLRLMLSQFDPADPVYFGCRFKHDSYVKQGYMSGGAGYVLSTEALRRFVEQALPEESKCRQSPSGTEDLEIGRCLEKVGVRAGDSRDTFGRHRFLALRPDRFLVPGNIDPSFWYWKRIYYPQTKGMGCCSEVAISFHYIDPSQMYVMEYLIYHLRLFGSIPRSHWRQEIKEKVKAASSSNIAKVDSTLSERENVTLIINDSGGNT